MLMDEYDFMSDTTEQTTTRFVTFISPGLHRFDLAITTTERFYGKKLITDLQSGITGIIGPDDLNEDGCIASIYKLDNEEATELCQFLNLVVGAVNFTE